MAEKFFEDAERKNFVSFSIGVLTFLTGYVGIENKIFSNFSMVLGIILFLISFFRFTGKDNPYSNNSDLLKITGQILTPLTILSIFIIEYSIALYLRNYLPNLPVAAILAVLSITLSCGLMIYHISVVKDFQVYLYRLIQVKKNKESNTEKGQEVDQKIHDFIHMLIGDLPEDSKAKNIDELMGETGQENISWRWLSIIAVGVFLIFGILLYLSTFLPNGIFLFLFTIVTFEIVRFYHVRYRIIGVKTALRPKFYTANLIFVTAFLYFITSYAGLPM